MNREAIKPDLKRKISQWRALCFLAFLGLFFFPLKASNPRLYVAFDRVLDNQGFTNSTVPSFEQDKLGFIWFATPNGLCRYDGYKCIVFKHDPNDPNSLSNNNVGPLYFDKKGILWIGTDEGLNSFDPSTETFTNYLADPQNPKSLSHNEIDVIIEDVRGYLWIGTYLGGANRFDRTTGEFKRFVNNPKDPKSISHNEIRSIIEDTEGNLWFGTADGLNLFNSQSETFTRRHHDPKNPNSICFNNIYALFEDQDDTIWIGTWGGGIDKFYPKENRFVHVPFKLKDKEYTEPIRVHFIHQDQSGVLWFGVHDFGLCRYVERDQSFVCYSNRPGDPRSLSSNRVVSIFEDRSSILWIGTRGGGISKYNPQKQKFYFYKDDPTSQKNLTNRPNKMILAICEDPDRLGEVYWIGTFNGLFRQDREQDSFDQYPNTYNVPNLPGKDTIRAIFFDKEKNCWLGTDVGLFQFNKYTGTFTPFDPKEISVGKNKSINTIMSDSRNRIWVGADEGLLLLNSEKKSIEKIDIIDYNSQKNPYSVLISICEEKKSKGSILWLGLYDRGIMRYNTDSKNRNTYHHIKGDSASLSNNNVRTILEDKNGTIWVGTDRGLNRFKQETSQFKNYSEKDGLCNERVFALAEDDIGRLWISTNSGLSKFDPETETFTNYDISHGLEINYFVQGACLKSWSGEIFLGGVNGFMSFYPHEITANPNIPEIVITDFKVRNKSLKTKDRLKKSITYTDQIELSYTDYPFSIEFTALDYTCTEKNSYAYKMEGAGAADWIDIGTNREMTFSWQKPGDYIFKLKGSNNDNVWNDSPRELHIKILPPWWQTWWAYSLYFSLLVFLLLAGHRYRVRQLKKKEEKLEKLVKQRTDELAEAIRSLREANDKVSVINDELKESMNELVLANDELRKANELKSEFLGIAAHDLKDPLQVILGYTDLLKKQLIENRISSKEIDSINRSVEKMLRLISKFLDAATFEKNELSVQKSDFNLSDLTDSVVRNNKILAERKHQNIIFFADSRCIVSGDRLLLRQVVENLISNAIKYSPFGKNIWVILEAKQSQAVLKVKDEGPGLTKEDQKNLFQKFKPLTPKPTGGETSTGLGLSICKRFVELHQGVLRAESEPGCGCTFIVELPLSQ